MRFKRYESMDQSNESINATDLYAGLTLTRLQAFVAVADHGGFSAAAAYLALGQSRSPSMSRRWNGCYAPG